MEETDVGLGNKIIFSFLPALLFCATAYAQVKPAPPLERIISLHVTNMPIGEVLKQVSEAGKFSFSYNSKSVDTEKKVNLHFDKKAVRYILSKLFEGTVTYKSKNNYIILNAVVRKVSSNAEIPKYIQISGYVFDKVTSGKLPAVTVFDQQTLYSAISDEYGYFAIQLPYEVANADLRVRKQGYIDTTYHLEKDYFQAVEIILRPKYKAPVIDTTTALLPLEIDTVRHYKTEITEPEIKEDKKGFSQRVKGFGFLLNQKMKTNLANLQDTFFRKVQFSLTPGVSTNKLVGTNVVNDVSFNVLAGYTGGVRFAEIGSLVNVVRGDVRYVQVGGLVNAVGGKTTGAQFAGLLNVCHDTVNGTQFAGLVNVNHTRSNGFQAAGLFNHSPSVRGVQVAGLYNYAKEIKGVQVAGLFNYAKKIKGVQIATFNFADSSTGIPIGVFSFVKHGYHKIEVSGDEIFYANVSFRTGVEKLHNNFSVGIVPGNMPNPVWTYGYGLGTSFHLSKKLMLDVDLGANHIVKKASPVLYPIDTLNLGTRNGWMNLNNKIYLGIDWQFAKKFSLAAGPTFNILLADTRNADYETVFNQLRSSYLYSERVNTHLQMNMWIGAKVAIRFL